MPSPQRSPNRSSIFTGCTPHTTGINRLPKDKPFGLQVGFTDPHRPYKAGAFHPPHDPKKVQVRKWLPDWPEVKQDMAHSYDFIARMDAEVGRLMELLASQGHSNDTMVLFTGDNGMPFPRAKGTLYEAGIHVPLIGWMPGKIAAGSVKKEMIGHVDLPSTWLDAAGIPQSKKMQGKSFLPLLVNQKYEARTEVFSERNWHDTFNPMRSIRTERYKFIFNAAPHFSYRPPSDLEGSPTRQELERKLSNWMNATYDFLPAGLGAANDPLVRSWPFTL